MAALSGMVAHSALTSGVGREEVARTQAVALLITLFAVQMAMMQVSHVYDFAQTSPDTSRPGLALCLLGRLALIAATGTLMAGVLLHLP